MKSQDPCPVVLQCLAIATFFTINFLVLESLMCVQGLTKRLEILINKQDDLKNLQHHVKIKLKFWRVEYRCSMSCVEKPMQGQKAHVRHLRSEGPVV
jgi:hypothetical protein